MARSLCGPASLLMAVLLMTALAFESALATVDAQESAGLLAVSVAFTQLPDGWNRTNFDDVCLDTTPTHVPTGVTCLNGHVSSLYLYGCPYNPTTGLSAAFAGLTYLKSLYLTGTNINVMPSEMSNMTNLAEVSWNANDKAGISVPAVLGQMPSLKKLHLVSNNILSVPDLSGDTALELLELSFSLMPSLDSAHLDALTTLKTFQCIRCPNLTAVPNMAASTSLQLIDVSYDEQLTTIPDMFANLGSFAQFVGTGCRQLTHLPASFGKMAIFAFNCAGCSLNQADSIPDMSMAKMTMVFLSNNGITTLPNGFCTFNKSILNTLDLSGNTIAALPDCFGDFSNMMSLDLTGNRLTAFPAAALANMPKLYSLKMGMNLMTGQLPTDALAALPALSMLVISDNQFEGSIPHALFHKEGLTFVDLSNNRLSGTIPDDFFVGCPLSSVMIEGNSFSGPFPSSINQATNVMRISAARNQFTSIPDTIGSMGGFFQWLDFANNKITHIPAESVWESLTSLMNIYLQDNPIGGPLPTWWVEAPISGGDYVCYINLTNCGFTGVLPALNSQHLNGIWLSGNKLTGWEGVVYAPNLNYLYLDHNKIETALMPAMANLTGLQELDVAFNKIPGSLPAAISSLSGLNMLRVNNNKLTGAVPSLAAMTGLEELDLSSNRLNLCASNPSFSPTAQLTDCDVHSNLGVCSCKQWYTDEGCKIDSC